MLRWFHDFRAWHAHPGLRLPATTNAMENMNGRICALLNRFSFGGKDQPVPKTSLSFEERYPGWSDGDVARAIEQPEGMIDERKRALQERAEEG